MRWLIFLIFLGCASELSNIKNEDERKEFEDISWNIKIHSEEKYLITSIKFPGNVQRFSNKVYKIEQRENLYKITWENFK